MDWLSALIIWNWFLLSLFLAMRINERAGGVPFYQFLLNILAVIVSLPAALIADILVTIKK